MPPKKTSPERSTTLFQIIENKTGTIVDLVALNAAMASTRNALDIFLARMMEREVPIRINKRDMRLVTARIEQKRNPERDLIEKDYKAVALPCHTQEERAVQRALNKMIGPHNDTGFYKSTFHMPVVRNAILALLNNTAAINTKKKAKAR